MNSRALPLVALLLAVAIFLGYVNRTWTGPIASTRIAIENNNKALIAADDYLAKQNILAAASNDIDPANLTKLSTFLPDSVDNVGLILDINALAARSGLALANIDVIKNDSGVTGNTTNAMAPAGALPVARANLVGSVDLALSAIGTYTALQSFISGIEKSARLLDVRDIVVKGSDTGVYNYQMIVRLYWLR